MSGWGQQGQGNQQGGWGQGGQGGWGQGQQGSGWNQGGHGGQQGGWGQGGQGGHGGQQGWGNPGNSPWSQGQPHQQGGQQGWNQQEGQQGWNQQGGQQGWNQQVGQVDFTQPFYPTPNQKYMIYSAKEASFVLDCNAENKLLIWTTHGGPNQQWTFHNNNDGTYSIRNVKNGGTLEIPDHSNAQMGVQLCISQPNGTINERWRIQPAQGSAAGQGFEITSAFNQNTLDIAGGKMNNGSKVILYKNNHTTNQTWAIRPC